MEEYLLQLFEQDGAGIFHTDYRLTLKLLEKYPGEPLRNDVYCINAILGGNIFYKSILTALANDNHGISRAEYNAIVDQMYSSDRFWKSENLEPSHFENILRMLYRVASVYLVDIPVTILKNGSDANNKEDLLNELSSAEAAYVHKNYRVALEKSKMLFENGIGTAALLLGRAYYYGNGTLKDYNKALFYLSYPHKKSIQQDKEERLMLDYLLELRDKTMLSSVICLIGSIVVFLSMLVLGFFSRHILFALFNTGLLIGGSVLFVIAFKKRLIFDFSLWFLVLGCMFLTALMM